MLLTAFFKDLWIRRLAELAFSLFFPAFITNLEELAFLADINRGIRDFFANIALFDVLFGFGDLIHHDIQQ